MYRNRITICSIHIITAVIASICGWIHKRTRRLFSRGYVHIWDEDMMWMMSLMRHNPLLSIVWWVSLCQLGGLGLKSWNVSGDYMNIGWMVVHWLPCKQPFLSTTLFLRLMNWYLGCQPKSSSLGKRHVECTCLRGWHLCRQYEPQAFLLGGHILYVTRYLTIDVEVQTVKNDSVWLSRGFACGLFSTCLDYLVNRP